MTESELKCGFIGVPDGLTRFAGEALLLFRSSKTLVQSLQLPLALSYHLVSIVLHITSEKMGNKGSIEYASFGLQGRRPTMEDAETTLVNYGGKPNQAFFGIFDGHVGPQCSKYVSQNLPKLLLKESTLSSNPKEALTNAFFRVDKEWLAKAKSSNPVMKDGSTGVVVLLLDQKIYCANTGDSRSVMYQGGKVVPLSFDQKPEDPNEQRRYVRPSFSSFSRGDFSLR